MNDFNAKSDLLREGEMVAVLYEPLRKYFAAQIKSVTALTITVNYVGYSDQANEVIRTQDVPARLAKGTRGESGFKEGDLAILIGKIVL